MKFLEKFDLARFCFLPFYLLALVVVCSNVGPGLADPDYFWHIKTGELIVSTEALPSVDPFSFTMADRILTHHAWLAQVIIHAVHEHLGERFVLLLVVLLASSAWYWSYQSARIFLPAPVSSLLCAALFTPGMLVVLTPRPQLFSFLFFAIFLHQLLSSRSSNSWRPLLLLPVVMALWVNMHGAYIMGLALLFAFVLAEGASALGARDQGYGTRFRWFAITLVASVAAACLNPDGPERLLFPFQLVTLQAADSITEWQPLRLNQPFGAMALLSGLLYFSITAYRRRAPDLLELALPISVFVAGITTLRYYPFTSLTMIPFLALAVADGAVSRLFAGPLLFVARLSERAKALWTSRVGPLAPRRSDPKAYRVHWAAAAVVVFLITPLGLVYGWSPERRDASLPVKAVDFLEANGIHGRMLNSYNIGGYLLYRVHPDRRVFIDPRTDLYGDAFFNRYLTLVRAQDGWQEILAEWAIDYAVLLSSEPLRAALVLDGGFAEVYEDGTYAVLVRREPRFERLIDGESQ